VSAAESAEVEHVASVTSLPSRVTPDPAPSLPVQHLPSFAQVAELVTPPDIWSDDRPSLRKVFLYGVYGRWTHAKGPVRVAGAIYATVISLPIHAVAYTLLWIIERPARASVIAVIGSLTYLTLN
jgi:hypothetical protein